MFELIKKLPRCSYSPRKKGPLDMLIFSINEIYINRPPTLTFGFF